MHNCAQTPGMSVYEHGSDVWKHAKQLISGDTASFKLPTWYTENLDYITSNIYNSHILESYTTFHDCGKPYCVEIDSEGRSHFPDHANVSKALWDTFFPDDVEVSTLIGLDMVMHTETAKEITDRNLDIKTSLTLLVVALAELHSNANMFGGIDSLSFKIKWKKLNKRGNMICKEIS